MTKSNNTFGKIWHWYPRELNRFSSMWWFFLLLPRQKQGFGPKQMVFALVSRAGDRVSINKVPHEGIESSRAEDTLTDPFKGISLGWIYDGEHMHDGLVQHPAALRVDSGKSIQAWDDDGYGGEIVAGTGREYATSAYFRGEKGEARFNVWGNSASEMTSPAIFERNTILGGANVLAWRQINFEGVFASPGGTEELSGVGYFQRICLNIMPFPWKWIYAQFADGSFFSCFIPYVGPHLLRRGDWFFPSWLENVTSAIQENAYFCRGNGWQTTDFSQVSVDPLLDNGSHPDFLVKARAENGDFLSFRANSYTHTQFLLERPLLGPISSCYNYNEYPFQISDLAGSIGGSPLDINKLGPGYGNCEYTWGLGI